MGDQTYFITEIVGTSTDSFAEAINNGIQSASQHYPQLAWFEVVEQRGHLSEGKVSYYQAQLKIGYRPS